MNIIQHYLTLIKFALRGDKGFYEAREYMAGVLIEELKGFTNLKNKKVLDVGGERGEFCKILAQKKNCQAINLEPIKLDFVHKTVIGSADRLPFDDESFDVVLFRGVLQHIPTNRKLKSLQEIYRVLKKDGLAYVMIPPWFNPLSGQTIKPFQYFPFKAARYLSNSIFSRHIKAESLAELGLWPMTFGRTKRYLNRAGFNVIKTTDILFRMHFLTKIPILRDFLLPSVGYILTRNTKNQN